MRYSFVNKSILSRRGKCGIAVSERRRAWSEAFCVSWAGSRAETDDSLLRLVREEHPGATIVDGSVVVKSAEDVTRQLKESIRRMK